MKEEQKYVLKYWISNEEFTKSELTDHVDSSLGKILSGLDYEIYLKKEYLILEIFGNEKNIDACYDKLNLSRNWAYRVQDDLGEDLRYKSYRILAGLELSFREFINRAMIEVGGFNWWNSLIPDKIKERVNQIEQKTDDKKIDIQHSLEFTHFDDLIKIITANFQELSDDENISTYKLSDIISNCSTFEEFKAELNERRKVISIWENVFSKYFENKEIWHDLKKRIQTDIIRTRHKVMHHRMIRLHEFHKLKECSGEVKKVIKRAKWGLSWKELEEARENLRRIAENYQNVINNIITDEFISTVNLIEIKNKNLIKGISENIKIPNIESNISSIINSIDWSSFSQLPPHKGDKDTGNVDDQDNENNDSDDDDSDEINQDDKE